jgi:phosphatidylglycerol:prolipoprotein diacylglycerol transferase
MHPELFTIPIVNWPVKSYGAMLTLGFLSGVWLSMKRAERMKCDPDVALNMGLVSLLCGVAGARIFYVIHYWESSFARMPNPLFAALNCTSGGLEYYGGLIGAIVGCAVYLAVRRVSVRMYLDLLTPAAAWGLAFGRMGCFLNGCCWGGVCVDQQGHAAVPWGITFPFSSPAETRQWENRQVTVPAELMATPDGMEAFLLPREQIIMPVEKREGPRAKLRAIEAQLVEMKAAGASADKLKIVEAQRAETEAEVKRVDNETGLLRAALKYPAPNDTDRSVTVSELEDMADQSPSLPVHPVQIYGIINALLLSWLLLEILYRRKRHGVVFAALCLIYPITRVFEEIVRVDNPRDSVGLTISQAVSVGMFAFGIIFLLALRRMPERSPLAVPFVMPQEPEPVKARA